MTRTSQLIYALSFIIASTGFLLSWWPLCAAGILIAALSGRWLFAALVGILIDTAWGAPQGVLHYLYFPFTLLALLAALGYYFLSGYFLDRTPPDTL